MALQGRDAHNLFLQMTKKEALKQFKLIFRDFLKNNRFDYVAKRETWNNWTDGLCKDGLITSWQYENWDQPFK